MYKKISRRKLLKLITAGVPGFVQVTSCSGESAPDIPVSDTAPTSEDTGQVDTDIQPDYSDTPVLSALRDFGSNWQTFWGCDLSNQGGRLGVFIDNSILYEGDFLLPENDFTGLVNAIDLPPGTHTYQMILNGFRVGSVYTFTTGPEVGEEFSILFFADTTLESGSAFNAICAREENIACVVGAELHYLDTMGLFGGQPDLSDGNSSALTADEPVSKVNYQKDIRRQYRFSRTIDPDANGRVLLDNKWPLFNVPGNHDLFISDSGGVDSLRRQPGRCLYDAAHDAAFEYVSNGHPRADGITDTAPAPPFYYNKTIADIDLIVTDGISYSDPFAIGSLGKDTYINNYCTAGDDVQESWFLSRVAESTASVIIIVFSTMTHGANSNWSQTISAWMKVNQIDKTIIIMAPDTHQSYALSHQGSGVLEFGFSPTSAVTSAKNYRTDNRYVFNSDMFNKTAVISGDQVFSGDNPAIINVNNSAKFRTGRKMSLSKGGDVYKVVSVGDSTIGVTNNDDSPPLFSVSDQQTIYSIDWPSQVDILTDSIGKRLCTYGKVTRYPNGSPDDVNPHTKIELLETYTGNIKFKGRVRDGERMVRL